MLRLCIAALALGLTACEMTDMGDPADGGFGNRDVEPAPDGALAPAEDLRINQMQMRATVNSYHDFVFDHDPIVAWRHPDLDAQAVEGIRVFDLDVTGDRVSWIDIHPATHEFPFDTANNCGVRQGDELISGNLVMCLSDLARWCDANPGHPLIVVLIGETDPGDRPNQLVWQLDDLEPPQWMRVLKLHWPSTQSTPAPHVLPHAPRDSGRWGGGPRPSARRRSCRDATPASGGCRTGACRTHRSR